MNYTGTLVGFKSSQGSIYSIVNDDSKCYAWKATVFAEFSDKMLNIVFNWNGDPFELQLSLLKDNYYTGKIINFREDTGKIYLWKYSKDDELMLKGDFIVDEYGTYECFVELRPKEIIVA